MITARTNTRLNNFQNLRHHWGTLEEVAEAMGMTFKSLEKMLERARARGDDRGYYHGMPLRAPRSGAQTYQQRIIEEWLDLQKFNLTQADEARALGISPEALRSRLYRARKTGMLPPAKMGRPPAISNEWIRAEWSRGQYAFTETEFCERLGISKQRLIWAIRDGEL